MKSAEAATRRFLTVMAVVFCFGTLANAWLLFRPVPQAPDFFNFRSAGDWAVLLVNALFMVIFYFILKRAASIYARIYWLALLAVFASGFLEKYVIRFSGPAGQLFSTVACAVICLLSLMFLRLHRDYRFNLFAGLTYRLKHEGGAVNRRGRP